MSRLSGGTRMLWVASDSVGPRGAENLASPSSQETLVLGGWGPRPDSLGPLLQPFAAAGRSASSVSSLIRPLSVSLAWEFWK